MTPFFFSLARGLDVFSFRVYVQRSSRQQRGKRPASCMYISYRLHIHVNTYLYLYSPGLCWYRKRTSVPQLLRLVAFFSSPLPLYSTMYVEDVFSLPSQPVSSRPSKGQVLDTDFLIFFRYPPRLLFAEREKRRHAFGGFSKRKKTREKGRRKPKESFESCGRS